MKKLLALALTIPFGCTPAVAGDYQPGWSEERTCFKTEYREEYVPGTEDSPGYVKSWKDSFEVPCEDPHPHVGGGNRHVPVLIEGM